MLARERTNLRRSSKSLRSIYKSETKFFTPVSAPIPPPRSAPATIRKSRRNVGDTVFISSSSKLLIKHEDNNAREAERLLDSSGVAEVEDYEEREREIRTQKDVPKIRNRIFEESLESQEISFYIGILLFLSKLGDSVIKVIICFRWR